MFLQIFSIKYRVRQNEKSVTLWGEKSHKSHKSIFPLPVGDGSGGFSIPLRKNELDLVFFRKMIIFAEIFLE